MSTTRWNNAMRLPYSEGGTTICEKHDFAYDNYMDSEMAWEVAEALRQAKDDGQRMEKRLQELGEEANNLEECLKDAENERDSAFAEIARLRAIPDLIRKRYPRMLERGNPLFDGVLADMLERCNNSSASAQQGVVVVPEYPIRDGATIAEINDAWSAVCSAQILRSQEGGA